MIQRFLASLRRFWTKAHHLLFVYAPNRIIVKRLLDENDLLLRENLDMVRFDVVNAQRWQRNMNKIDQNNKQIRPLLYTKEEMDRLYPGWDENES